MAVVASYFTWSAASGWAATFAWGSTMGTTATLTVAGGAVAGAIAGAVGGVILTGTLKGAFQGTVSGAIMGGVVGHFGDTYSAQRIAADSVTGGLSSEIYGQKFKDGLLIGALLSSATYLTVRARAYSIQQSKKVPHNIGSDEFEFRGLKGKIEGERINSEDWNASGVQELIDRGVPVEVAIEQKYIPYRGGVSPLGCVQSGYSCLFGMPVEPTGLVSYVMGGFGGVHDMLNQPFYYNVDGTNRALKGVFEKTLGKVINPVNVVLAAPIVVPALIPDYMRHLYFEGAQ